MGKKASVFTVGMLMLCTFMQGLTIYKLQGRVTTLENQQEINKDLSDGVDRHLQFVDSDHAKLGNDIARLRQDFDNHRYHHEYVEER